MAKDTKGTSFEQQLFKAADKLRLTVRKILIKYGYPPDLARMEADRVIEQSEVLAEVLTK